MSLARRFDSEAGGRDVQAADKARELGGRQTKAGLIGYSLGGRMAPFAVARTNIDAAVGYYGVRIHLMLGETRRISRPLMLHVAALDAYVDGDAQAELHRAFDDHPLVTLHDYAGAHRDLGYGCGPLRAEGAGDGAEQRTMSFLEARLGLAAEP